ncbi:phosphatidylserine decarboxylase [Gemmobacter sp.]|uniref:phosphatidylserine decarboxylase n=1 Tax=Gemmobacter sp. TaxID=1898957 RepID=UPI002AFDD611|nr:phosphatidylserine decarboxylase [Gemmobacter sp.]
MAGGSAFARLKVRLHPEGRKFVAIFAAVTLVLFLIWEPLGWLGVVLTIWCLAFFRDPIRAVPQAPGLVVSPADGVVQMIERVATPPELGMRAAELTRISVFMDVFDCHVNRAPVGGTVTRVAYVEGKFLNASLDKASLDNERNGLVLALADGREVGVVQIAGLVARRILCWTQGGQTLETGERFGLIRFGSRVDVYLPDGVAPLVAVGQKAVAGETILADLTAGPAPRRARMI